MQIQPFVDGAIRPVARAPTLIAKYGTVWLWPGIPLTVTIDGETRPLPRNCTQFWISRLHGFEANPASLVPAMENAARHLTLGCESAAQSELDRAGLNRLSPEGDALADATAIRLGIKRPRMPVGERSAPWGMGEVNKDVALFDAFTLSAVALEKVFNEKDHPRAPKLSPDGQGGEFVDANSGGSAGEQSTSGPGMGHNEGPALEDLPEIPEDIPSTSSVRTALLRNIGSWLIRRGIIALIPGVGEAAMIVQLGLWLYEYLPYLDAYIQPPQSLEELQNAVGTPQPGTDVHHIVEQTSAEKDGFSRSEIDSPENTVRISTLKHYQISGWYSRRNPDYGNLSPRDYLRGKDWSTRMKVGRDALIQFKVLKP